MTTGERRTPSLTPRQRFGVRRTLLALVAFGFSMVVLVSLAGGAMLMMLVNGTINIDLAGQIAAALNSHVGGGYAFSVGSTAITGTSLGPSLTINGFAMKDGRDRTIVAAPRASLSVDPLSLVFGQVSPKRLELDRVSIHLVRLEDGTMAVSAGADQAGDLKLSNLASTLSDPHDTGNPATPAAAGAATLSTGEGRAPVFLPSLLAKAVSLASNTLFDNGSPLRAVDRFGMVDAALIVDDRLRGTTTTYRNLSIEFDREPTGGVFVTVSADGPAGHWSGVARASRGADGSRRIDLAADRLSPDEIMLAAGLRAAGFETDMPLSFSLTVEVGPDGRLLHAGGPISLASGYFKLDDPDHEPAMIDRIETTVSMDPATGTLDFGNGEIVADATRYNFGVTAVPPAKADDPWTVSGKGHGTFGAERPGELPIALDRLAFTARYFAQTHQLMLDSASAAGPAVDFKIAASFQPTDTGFLVKSDMQMGRMPGMDVIRLWPNWVAAPVRAWFLRCLQGGTFEWGRGHLSLTNVDLDRMRAQHSVPDDHVHIEFGVADGALGFIDGVPPLRGLDGTGVLTGDSFTFKASKGEMEVAPGHRLQASEGSLFVPSTDPKPTPGVIAMRVTGAIDTLADLLSRDALKPYANLPIDTSAVAGSFDGRLTVNLKFGSHRPQDDTKIGVVATAKDFSASKVIGKEPLQDATLSVVADPTGIHAKGDGRMFGAPASIELKKPAGGGPSEATMTLTLDDAARQKAGFAFGRTITGPLTAKIATSFSTGEKNKASVLLDFTHCAFDAPLPGLKKPAERSAKATFTVLQDNGRTQLDNIVFDSGSTAIRGAAVLDANGGLATAQLSQMRLSPGDDARVDIVKAGDALKATVRGSNIDARPFLKYVTGGESSSGSGAGDTGAKDLDLDLHANLLTGENAQALSNADIRLVKHANQLRKIQMSGRLGRGTITANTSGSSAAPIVVIAAKDAGAVLSFLDLYKRMDGGQLDTTLRFGDNRMDGSAVVHNFTIREDPSIKKLAEEEIPSGSRNAGGRIDPSAVSFTKLEANFTRVANKVDVRQGSMYGPQLGATVEGSIDFAHDKVALSGTLVPLYGLNNLFSQIPVVGLLLGGGSHEGLFALNYRIVGSASAPVFSFNPLSALAPGFLRKIFGAIDDAAQEGLHSGPPGQPHDPGQASDSPPALPE